MAKWLRAARQTTTFFGVAVLVIIWGTIYLLNAEQRDSAYRDAVRQGANLTRVLEEYIRRVVDEADHSLRLLRRAYRNEPRQFDIAQWVAHTQFKNELTVKFAIVGTDGFILQSSTGPLTAPVYVGDRAHFKFHAAVPNDLLYIDSPALGRMSKVLSIQFTRRTNNADGSFAGTVGCSLSVDELEQFFSSLDIGRDGAVSLIKNDGTVLARGGKEASSRSYTGMSISGSPLFDALRRSSSGSYWNTPASSAKFGGGSRLVSYRVVGGTPLIAVVSLSRDSIFALANAALRKYALAGGALTAIVLVVMVLGTVRQTKIMATTGELHRSKRELEQTNHILQTALKYMTHGLCLFDREQHLLVSNQRYGEMYHLEPEQIKPGTTLRSILEARVAVGMMKDGEDYVRRQMDEVAKGRSFHITNELNGGRIYSISHQPTEDGGWVSIHQDITEQKRVEQTLVERTEALRQSHAQFEAALQNMSQGLCMIDSEQRIMIANERYRQIYDLPEELIRPGTTLGAIVEHRAANGNYAGPAAEEYLAAQLSNSSDIERLGNGRVVLVHRRPMLDGSWLTTHEDITERWRHEARVAFMAHHDALTGLANRAALVEKIEDACARCRRWNEHFNVLMVDLDRFKQVNDTFGHPAGDKLLRQVAERIKAALSETDVLARLGGDEFAIIQVNRPNQVESAETLGVRLLDVVNEPFSVDGNVFGIGASIGIALAPEHGVRSEDLLKTADLALYHAKSLGRNRYAIFDPALGQAAQERHILENDLRRAIANDELKVHFQPIVDAHTMEMRCAEALLRWHHPERGPIPPDLFIPLAEESGTIVQIGEWVLQAACAEAAKWPAPIKVAVNVSAVQLRNPNLLDYIMCVLVETGLAPERLELEITETALIEYGTECLMLLKKLKNMGITVTLDDFGIGYSSLNQLTIFPFDKIKIDKSFTRNMINRPDCAAIISAVMALAQSMNIATTAEGVESEEQLRILRLAGVTTVQGFLIQRPCPASELNFDEPVARGVAENAA